MKEKIIYFLRNNITIIILLFIAIITVVIYNLINNNSDEIIIETEETITEEKEVIEELEEKESKIFVHVVGMVLNPGVYELNEGDRVNDAIKIAGGALEDADLSSINLVEKLEDGVQIKISSIYSKNELEKSQTKSAIAKSNSAIQTTISNQENTSQQTKTEIETNEIININTATKEQLTKLNGIGEKTAEKIIAYREQNGNFKTIEDIKNVSGIGDAKYEKIKEKIII